MNSNTVQLRASSDNNESTQYSSIEKLQTTILFLTTKYAQTNNMEFARAVYQHLCLINDHDEASSELKFFSQSLIMEWRLIVCMKGSPEHISSPKPAYGPDK